MKKFFLISVIASMVIFDLVLTGQSVAMGILLLCGAALFSFGFDQAHQQKKQGNNVEMADKKAKKYVTKHLYTTFCSENL